MRRGDVVIAAVPGQSAVLRPYVVVQGNWTLELAAAVTLCPIATEQLGIGRIRVPVQASPETGLAQDGEVEVDQVVTVRKSGIERVVGALPGETMRRVDRSLKNWLDL